MQESHINYLCMHKHAARQFAPTMAYLLIQKPKNLTVSLLAHVNPLSIYVKQMEVCASFRTRARNYKGMLLRNMYVQWSLSTREVRVMHFFLVWFSLQLPKGSLLLQLFTGMPTKPDSLGAVCSDGPSSCRRLRWTNIVPFFANLNATLPKNVMPALLIHRSSSEACGCGEIQPLRIILASDLYIRT